MIDRFSLRLLRRHVRNGAEDQAFAGGVGDGAVLVARFDQLCQTEVEHLGEAVACHHDVVRFEIAMHNACSMSFAESFGGMLQVAQQL